MLDYQVENDRGIYLEYICK